MATTRARRWWVPALLVTVAPALAGLLPAVPSSAARQICVAVVVDFRTLGGSVASTCAKVPDGTTGTQVLKAAGHTMTFRSDGLICTIDGQPAQGCSATDSSHYWAYWHRPAGSSTWQYSSEGSGTYQPANNSSDGWVWQNGGPEGSDPPPNIPESQICPPAATATPPAAPARPAPAPAPAATAAAAPVPATGGGSAPGVATAGATGRPPATRAPAAAKTSPAVTATSAAPAGGSTATPPPDPAGRTRAAAHSGGKPGGGFPTGLVVGVAVAVALGGGALLRARR